MSERINISTSFSDSYKVMVGYDLLNQVKSFITEEYPGQKLIVVIDENVQKIHGKEIFESLNNSFNTIIHYVVPAGEQSKNIEQYAHIIDVILKSGIERQTPLLAIGGGVTGDLTGFVAASVLRGIPLIHMPTTLLAMVDSSIGGKTGINHEVGKNLVGAFYQPKAVFSDLKYLETLPKQEWISGLSEILKYGFISDSHIFEELDELIVENEFTTAKAWLNIIAKSAAIKVDFVSKDVKESGIREFLNFGHTFAHVIERQGKYKMFTHGEAVFMGMVAAVFVSNELGATLNTDILLRYKDLYNLKLNSALECKQLTALMLHDKKVANSTIRLVLLKNLESPFTQKFEHTAIIENAWDSIIEEFN